MRRTPARFAATLITSGLLTVGFVPAADATPPQLTNKKLTVKGNFADPGLLVTGNST